MTAVVLDRGSWDRGDIDVAALESAWPRWRWHEHTGPEELHARLADARLVVTNKVVLDREAMAAAPHLELICVAATGTNNVDAAAAAERGVAVRNVPGYATPSVVQHTYALMLALATRLGDYRRVVEAGAWQRSRHFCVLDFPIRELAGRTLGIVGYGTLGRAVADLGRALGMDVLVAARPGTVAGEGRVALQDILPCVDVLSLHVPLTPQTRGLIGARELGLMRRDALLINTARGGIVDEAALAEALRSGRLGGAGVDVLSTEPPAQDNPLLAPDLAQHNLILTPHIAWASREARQRLIDAVARNIREHGLRSS